ncbi:gustatory receptor for sugar taste 64a-like isoform X2 [Anopheles stephensi]|uniref:gustatory receptor for sugar taste 64a-like isoform X2 n=1 Tax=Anopheles stephensi TaxID=30069 RepID=UPI0007D21ED1|nr:gustatory receptor for sugar taste 64a-like isoform X2 [Anopheles stephensi]
MTLATKGFALHRKVRQRFQSKMVDDERDTFLRGARPFIILGQLFGIFPIYGITANEPTRLRLKWFSVRVILNLTVVVTALVQAYYEYGRLKMIGINAKNVSGLIFYLDACLINVLFLNLATKWRTVAAKWGEVDETFNRAPYQMVGCWSLRKRLCVISFSLVFLAAVEHCLSVLSGIHNQYAEVQYCNWTVTNYFRHYSLRRFANVYINYPYHPLSAVFFTYVSFALTMYWNYQDIFIIMLSIALATRFQQINNHLKILSDGVLIPGEDFWIRVRTNYVSVCELLDDVDRVISWTMLISCATNLYYICLQILHVSKKLANTIEDAYYWFSLVFLIVRTVIVFLSAAHIHDCAKKPLEIIMKIPNVGWCVELERFSTQLKSEKVALSGMGFFSLTRQLLFSMAGTIVTYELVMLKFDEESESKGNIPLCTKFAFEKL